MVTGDRGYFVQNRHVYPHPLITVISRSHYSANYSSNVTIILAAMNMQAVYFLYKPHTVHFLNP